MIRVLCIESGAFDAKFRIQKGQVKAGETYYLEHFEEGSNNQLRLIHSLIRCFYQYMFDRDKFKIEEYDRIYDLSCPDHENLKEMLKYKYGRGFSHINYVDKDYQIVKVKSMDEIPTYVLDDFNHGDGNRMRIKGVIISLSDYSKKQRQDFIDNIFKLMDIYGVNSREYKDIRRGLEKIRKENEAKAKRARDEKRNKTNL